MRCPDRRNFADRALANSFCRVQRAIVTRIDDDSCAHRFCVCNWNFIAIGAILVAILRKAFPDSASVIRPLHGIDQGVFLESLLPHKVRITVVFINKDLLNDFVWFVCLVRDYHQLLVLAALLDFLPHTAYDGPKIFRRWWLCFCFKFDVLLFRKQDLEYLFFHADLVSS